jgi:hypothetical protein
MTKLMVTAPAAIAAVMMAASVTVAQPATGVAGHWEGAIDTPQQPLAIQVDLKKTGDKWDGTITIPAQNLKGYPLGDLNISGDSAKFVITGAPGTPTFNGKRSPDGKVLSGEFVQGGTSMTFKLTRTGDAQIEPLPKSTPITKDLEGSWAGTLSADGKMLHLGLKLTNQPTGATGTVISVDQGNAQIPVTAVVQTGTHLKLVLRPIAATFEGDLKNGELTGTWTQGMSLPLVFTRPK